MQKPIVRCSRCNYKWTTKSELIMVTCPSCGYKVKNKKAEEKKDEDNGRD